MVIIDIITIICLPIIFIIDRSQNVRVFDQTKHKPISHDIYIAVLC